MVNSLQNIELTNGGVRYELFLSDHERDRSHGARLKSPQQSFGSI